MASRHSDNYDRKIGIYVPCQFVAGVGAVQVRNKVNPIWHVVNLLQEMAKKITEEGEQETAMYKNFECHCRTTSQELKTNVEEGSARILESTSKIQAEEGILVELKTVIKVSQESHEKAKLWMTKVLRALISLPTSMRSPLPSLPSRKVWLGTVSSRAASALPSARLPRVWKRSQTATVPRCCPSCRSVTVRDTHQKAAISSAF